MACRYFNQSYTQADSTFKHTILSTVPNLSCPLTLVAVEAVERAGNADRDIMAAGMLGVRFHPFSRYPGLADVPNDLDAYRHDQHQPRHLSRKACLRMIVAGCHERAPPLVTRILLSLRFWACGHAQIVRESLPSTVYLDPELCLALYFGAPLDWR